MRERGATLPAATPMPATVLPDPPGFVPMSAPPLPPPDFETQLRNGNRLLQFHGLGANIPPNSLIPLSQSDRGWSFGDVNNPPIFSIGRPRDGERILAPIVPFPSPAVDLVGPVIASIEQHMKRRQAWIDAASPSIFPQGGSTAYDGRSLFQSAPELAPPAPPPDHFVTPPSAGANAVDLPASVKSAMRTRSSTDRQPREGQSKRVQLLTPGGTDTFQPGSLGGDVDLAAEQEARDIRQAIQDSLLSSSVHDEYQTAGAGPSGTRHRSTPEPSVPIRGSPEPADTALPESPRSSIQAARGCISSVVAFPPRTLPPAPNAVSTPLPPSPRSAGSSIDDVTRPPIPGATTSSVRMTSDAPQEATMIVPVAWYPAGYAYAALPAQMVAPSHVFAGVAVDNTPAGGRRVQTDGGEDGAQGGPESSAEPRQPARSAARAAKQVHRIRAHSV